MRRITKLATVLLVIATFSACARNYEINFSQNFQALVPEQADFKNKKLALVLGGGGAKGFAHVGVLEELDKAGIKPDVIIGCSAGAIVGALYAANPNIDHLKEVVLNGKERDLIISTINDWPFGVFSQAKMRSYLQTKLQTHNFANLKIPFVATATNLQFGNLTAFSKGDLVNAVVASAAFPGAFKPVQINNQYFVDCGVADPVPVHIAKELGFEKVIAVNIAEELPANAPGNLFGVSKRSLEIAYISLSKYATESADVVIDFNFNNIGIFNDKHNQYLYEQGKLKTQEKLTQIKSLLRT